MSVFTPTLVDVVHRGGRREQAHWSRSAVDKPDTRLVPPKLLVIRQLTPLTTLPPLSLTTDTKGLRRLGLGPYLEE